MYIYICKHVLLCKYLNICVKQNEQQLATYDHQSDVVAMNIPP